MGMRSDVRLVLRILLDPVLNLILRFVPVRDPWERYRQRIPLRLYGSGSQRDFSWYLEGQSQVSVSSIDEIQEWLLGCEYADDKDLFHEPDFWQHPRTFEHLRRGDCEDHALWAWRKLVELGVDAELISGQQLAESGVSDASSGHVWVVFRRGEETIVFETVAKSKDLMLKPLQSARAEYRPEVGVNGARKQFAYHGFLLTLKERRRGQKAVRIA